MKLSRACAAVAALALAALPQSPVFAWGNTGHRMIGTLAVQALPAELPAFVRTRAVALDMGELAREPDRWKGAGKTHDTDRDPAHFLDLDDDDKVLGGPKLFELPATRAEYETALRAAGADSWKAGYLPYSIVDGYQQLTSDFAYWRVLAASEKRATGERKAWYRADRLRREALILRDMGTLAHYAGDGSQPLHVTVHFNGWGDYPNPQGFTKDKIHGPFEGDYTAKVAAPAAVKAKMTPFTDCNCTIWQRTSGYLDRTGKQAVPLYVLWKDGGFKDGDARGVTFVEDRLAAGASELRDLYVLAWRDSADSKVGWPAVSVADVVAGKADAWDAMRGKD